MTKMGKHIRVDHLVRGLLDLARAVEKTVLAVSLDKHNYQNSLIRICHFLGPVIKSYVVI